MKISLNELTRQHSSLVKEEGGVAYRDLNRNGRLDIYEDTRQPIEARAAALLADYGACDGAVLDVIFGLSY